MNSYRVVEYPRTIEIFEPCERFLSGFDKNLSQASKIIVGCRNGDIILIPTYDSAPAYHCKLTKKRRGRIKGGAATTTASSDVDFDVTGRRGRDKRAREDGPA
jgi:hypothetical protein